MTSEPALEPVRDAVGRGDLVCWGDPHAAALHEGIVGRVFDRFVEIEHRDGCALSPTMVYKSRLAAIAYSNDEDETTAATMARSRCRAYKR